MIEHGVTKPGLSGRQRPQPAVVERTLLEGTARAWVNADGGVGVGLSIVVGGAVHSIGSTTLESRSWDSGQAEDDDSPCMHAP